jgi:hypothetical protein
LDDGTDGYNLYPAWGPDLGMEHNRRFTLDTLALLSIDKFLAALFSGEVDSNGVIYTDGHLQSTIQPNEPTLFGYPAGSRSVEHYRMYCYDCQETSMCPEQCRYGNFQDLPGYTPVRRWRICKTNKIFVEMRWQWIALPVFVCLLGVVTLVGTMWENRRADVPNWKNDLGKDGQHNDVLDDEHKEENVKVRLYKSGDKAVLGISL